jgi:transposase, IS30 family
VGNSRSTTRRLQERFWQVIRVDGLPAGDAGLAVGVSAGTGRLWFREAGGVMPAVSVRPGPVAYRRLSFEEREQIALGLAAGDSAREIARRLHRAPSTVTREIARHRGAHVRSGYLASRAQHHAIGKAARPKPARLATCLPLRAEVQRRLRLNHSPEQIARRLRQDFPDRPEMHVSHETIYQSLYVQSRGGLKRELVKHLRTGRSLRKPHRREDQRRGRIKDMVMISERPAEVQDRSVPGHWEGDLIVGADSASAIGTLVERTTRFVMLLHLPAGHGALEVQQAMIDKMSQLPQILRRTLTWDQGKEMTHHAAIAEATGLAIYFCDPHSPWQRGSNENTNGLLRQYFPKGSDLTLHGPGYLEFVAAELNNRPRKTLDWKTPAEALDALLSDPSNPPGVALTG